MFSFSKNLGFSLKHLSCFSPLSPPFSKKIHESILRQIKVYWFQMPNWESNLVNLLRKLKIRHWRQRNKLENLRHREEVSVFLMWKQFWCPSWVVLRWCHWSHVCFFCLHKTRRPDPFWSWTHSEHRWWSSVRGSQNQKWSSLRRTTSLEKMYLQANPRTQKNNCLSACNFFCRKNTQNWSEIENKFSLLKELEKSPKCVHTFLPGE